MVIIKLVAENVGSLRFCIFVKKIQKIIRIWKVSSVLLYLEMYKHFKNLIIFLIYSFKKNSMEKEQEAILSTIIRFNPMKEKYKNSIDSIPALKDAFL